MFYKIQIITISWLLLSGAIGVHLVERDTFNGPVSYTIEASETTVKSGDQFSITIVFNIEPGWYVYAPIAMNTALGKIPTKVAYKVPKGIEKINGLELPNNNDFFDTYKGKGISMTQKFQVDKKTLPGKYNIRAMVVYQTCNDDICYPPVRETKDIAIIVY